MVFIKIGYLHAKNEIGNLPYTMHLWVIHVNVRQKLSQYCKEIMVERGFRIGNTCTPMADSCQCMAKPMQYCKVKENKFKKNLKNKIK